MHTWTEIVLPPGLGLTFGPELPSLADARAARAAAETAATAAAAIAAGTAPALRGRNGSMSRRYLRAAAFSARRSAAAAAELAATVGMHAANRVLRAVQPRTWTWLWACQVVRRYAADAIARARSIVAQRARTLALLAQRPRALNYDVAYDSETGVFSFRSACGEIFTRHPTAADDHPVSAYAADGSTVAPLQPPDDSSFVLAPEANGCWCYVNPATGETAWHAPAGSQPLQTCSFVDVPPFSGLPPALDRSFTVNSQALQRFGRWMPIYRDRQDEIHFLNLNTGAVRAGPWISLRTEHGCVFFANLLTRDTRWFPPHQWMDHWIARMQLSSDRGRDRIRWVGASGEDDPTIYVRPDVMRHVLDPQLARLCVEGGAPYLHACGMPPYAPDAFDTPDTHPAVPYYGLSWRPYCTW